MNEKELRDAILYIGWELGVNMSNPVNVQGILKKIRYLNETNLTSRQNPCYKFHMDKLRKITKDYIEYINSEHYDEDNQFRENIVDAAVEAFEHEDLLPPVTAKKAVGSPDWVFTCRKCQHELYIGKERLAILSEYDCDECGEEPDGNWIFQGEGDYEDR